MPDFPLITQRYGPAVVNISVTGRKPAGPDLSDPMELFRQFQRDHPTKRYLTGLGSGVGGRTRVAEHPGAVD